MHYVIIIKLVWIMLSNYTDNALILILNIVDISNAVNNYHAMI